MKKFEIRNSRFEILAALFILLLAGFWRFHQLNQVPPSLSLDEVSIGWNAYSILETGRDEYGTKLPILLRAYDDWRPALYVYLVIPFIKIFGLSTLAVRLPSVILSLIVVLTSYFLVKEIFPKRLITHHSSLVTSFLLAISPWHIYISRLGHEVNLSLTLSALAIFFFLRSIHRRKRGLLFLSALFFALSFYTYQSQKIFGPLIILALGLIFRKQLLARKKDLVLASLLGLVLIMPLLRVSLSSEAMVRFQATSIFVNQSEVEQRGSWRIARDYQKNDIWGLVFDNRKVAAGLTVLRAYFSHFDPVWLFFNQGEEKHKIPDMGLFYLWELPLLLIGGYQLAKGKFSKESKLLVFSWLLFAPLPASIATEAPHAMRTFSLLPVPQMLAAIGMTTLILKVKFQKCFKLLIFSLGFLFLIFNFFYLYHHYFVNFPYEQSGSFQYPLTQAINYVLRAEDRYQKIIFSNQDNGYQSYMFFLFFSQYDPRVYLNQGGTVSGGYDKTHQIGKYEFRPINWEEEKKEDRTLYVGNVVDFPSSVEPIFIGEYLDNKAGFKVVEGSQ